MENLLDLSGFWPEWKIEKQIGSGSFGKVYEAVKKDEVYTKHSAIKIISIPSSNAEIESMSIEGITESDSRTYYKQVVNDIVEEITIMEVCKGCSNIVNIEDFKVIEKEGELHFDIFIRMELLTPLNSYLSDKKLTEEEVIKLGKDISTALEVCAEHNIIHRDIKPENIFVDSLGNFKLGDFGIARTLENMTFGLSQKGTFNYMAPEVFNSSFYDKPADMYSLGLVLYRLLNKNRLPFLDTEKQLLSPAERRLAVERRLKGDPLPKPAEASDSLSKVILKACEYNPKDRYSNITKFKEALIKVSENKKEEMKRPVSEVSENGDLIINLYGEEKASPFDNPLFRALIISSLVLLLVLVVEFMGLLTFRRLSKERLQKPGMSENAETLEASLVSYPKPDLTVTDEAFETVYSLNELNAMYAEARTMLILDSPSEAAKIFAVLAKNEKNLKECWGEGEYHVYEKVENQGYGAAEMLCNRFVRYYPEEYPIESIDYMLYDEDNSPDYITVYLENIEAGKCYHYFFSVSFDGKVIENCKFSPND